MIEFTVIIYRFMIIYNNSEYILGCVLLIYHWFLLFPTYFLDVSIDL